MSRQQFSLRWNNYLRHVTNAFDSLRSQEDLVDVTLSCEGKKIKAHKMLLSACSSYFKDIFKENPCQHPVIIFRNVRYDDLWAIINFMYHGEVNILQEQLASFLTTAELLEVQGLTDGTDEKDNEGNNELEVIRNQVASEEFVASDPPFHAKKRKLSFKKHVELDSDITAEVPEIDIISINTVASGNNLKLESIEHLDDTNIGTLGSNAPSTSVVTFPEAIEICDSEVFENPNLLHELKPSDGNNTNSDATQDIMVAESALKDSTQGLLDWNKLLYTQNEISTNLVTLSATTSPVKEMITLQCDRKVVALNSDKLVKIFSCNICEKVFSHPNSLAHHRKFHNGQIQCTVCEKSYTRAYDLKRHIRTSHMQGELKKK